MKNSDWKEVRLGDVAEVGRGSSPRPIEDQTYFVGGDIPWIKIADATASGKYIMVTKEHVNSFGASFSRYLPKNSLIIAASGVSLGQIKLLGVEGCIHDGWLYLSNFKDIDYQYLYYQLVLVSKSFHNYSYGAAIQNINTEILRNIKIPLPPLPTQQKIADILGAYDELIENNRRRIALLENMAAGLYKEWFVRMRPHGQILPTNAETGLPVGWEVVKISELYNTASGGTPSREKEEYFGGEINWIKTGELVDGFLFETEEKITDLGLKNSSAKLFPPLTVIIAMYGATIGQLGITTAESSTNQACCALLPKTDEFGSYYIFMTLLIQRGELINFGNGAAQQNISQDEIKKFKILKPDSKTMVKFNEIITPLFNQIKTLQEQTGVLRRVRDRLLPRLMSGALGG